MNCKELFEEIDGLYPHYVDVWKDVCNIESPTNYKQGVDRVCKYFENMAKELGFYTEILKNDIAGNALCITMNGESDEAPICFSGHIDTVHPVGSFGDVPVRIEDEMIYGPGVMDCKGGCVSSIMAMEALSKTGYKKRPVKLILQSDEEMSSITSNKETINFMIEKAKGAIAFFNTEPLEKGKATLERKGIMRFRINITGIARHSSVCYKAANAIREAAYKIIELEKMKNPDGVTCNIGVIEGGTVGNTVAEKCSFIVDIRYSTEKEKCITMKKLNKIVQKSFVKGTSSELVEISSRPAMEKADRNYKLLERINKIYRENGLEELEAQKSKAGSDASYITLAGIPCIDSMGTMGENLHSTKESSYLESLKISARYMATAVINL